MKLIDFGQAECKQLETYLDSYVNNELTVETSHKLAAHLEGCESCANEVEARMRLRSAVKKAVRAQPPAIGVEERIRARLREEQSKAALRTWTLPLAVAATVLIGVFVWNGPVPEPWRTAMADQEAHIDSLNSQVPPILQVGLGDHVHCAYYRKLSEPMSESEMSERLGARFEGLPELASERISEDFQTVLGHHCRYRGRNFIHVALQRTDELLSVVLTRRRSNDSFSGDDLAPVLDAAGVPVYGAGAGEFEVAAFETSAYLGFVVSNLPAGRNLEVAEALTPPLKDWLDRRSEGLARGGAPQAQSSAGLISAGVLRIVANSAP